MSVPAPAWRVTSGEVDEALNRAALREDVAYQQAEAAASEWRIEGAEALELSTLGYAARHAVYGTFVADHANDHVLDEGPQWEIVPGPGCMQVRTRDYARIDRRVQRHAEGRRKLIDVLAADPDLSERERLRRQELAGTKIFGFSRKARNELRHKIGKLDLSPMIDPGWLPETITLTYPGVGGDPDAPDDRFWLLVAPDGAAVKRALKRFRKRFEYRWGRYVDGVRVEPGQTLAKDVQVAKRLFYGVLKLEFQRRGAPHQHIGGALPADDRFPDRVHRDFRGWLSDAWAECVWSEVIADLPDPDDPAETLGRKWMERPEIVLGDDGLPTGRGWLEVLEAHHPGAVIAYLNHRKSGTRVGTKESHGPMTDPRRFTTYFLKEGMGGAAKAYQDQPPEQWATTGTGRIWQVWGFQEATAVRAVTPEDGIAAGRIMRRWYRAEIRRDVERASRLPFGPCRDKREQGLRDRGVRLRRSRGLFRQNRGRVLVNDGEQFTLQLARALRLPKLGEETAVGRNARRRREAQRRRAEVRRVEPVEVVVGGLGEPGPYADDGCPTCVAMGSGDVGVVLDAMMRPSGLPGECPGIEWQHADGVEECTEGLECTGDHGIVASCSMSSLEVDHPNFVHRCVECSA